MASLPARSSQAWCALFELYVLTAIILSIISGSVLPNWLAGCLSLRQAVDPALKQQVKASAAKRVKCSRSHHCLCSQGMFAATKHDVTA